MYTQLSAQSIKLCVFIVYLATTIVYNMALRQKKCDTKMKEKKKAKERLWKWQQFGWRGGKPINFTMSNSKRSLYSRASSCCNVPLLHLYIIYIAHFPAQPTTRVIKVEIVLKNNSVAWCCYVSPFCKIKEKRRRGLIDLVIYHLRSLVQLLSVNQRHTAIYGSAHSTLTTIPLGCTGQIYKAPWLESNLIVLWN